MDLHRMADDELIRFEPTTLSSEWELEEQLSVVPGMTIGGIDVFYAHRQGITDDGKKYDIVGFDANGNTVTIELKHDRSPRTMVAQALGYAANHYALKQPYKSFERRFRQYTGRTGSLRDAHADYFDLDEPLSESVFNTGQRIILIAGRFSDHTLNIVEYLQQKGHDITCVEYDVFVEGDEQILLTQPVLLPKSVVKTSSSSKVTLKKKRRHPLYREVFDRVFDSIRDTLADSKLEQRSDLLRRPFDESNELNVRSLHSDHPSEFFYDFKVIPESGKLMLRLSPKDDTAKEIVSTYRNDLADGFEYNGEKRTWGAVVKRTDISHLTADMDWDKITPEEIAERLLEDETVLEFIDEYVAMIERWHPRLVADYPTIAAESESKAADENRETVTDSQEQELAED
ncbi:MAG TPA: hypothetical protein VFJ06_03280 [Halococcus sp.]|nr:hypothetical protein [Halococcus sp.]